MDPKLALQEADLTGNEAKIYLALLELGSALAGEITKKSGINRTNVYDALDRLIEKGIVSYVITANRKYFEATNPERIISYLEEKENAIKEQKKLINQIMPELKIKRQLSKEPQEATIYKGKKGIKSLAEDVIRTKQNLQVYGAEGEFMKLMGPYGQLWQKKRIKENITLKIIYNEKRRKLRSKSHYSKYKRRFNSTIEDTPATTWIYGNKTAIIVWSEQPIATVIRSKDVAYSYKQFFDIIWANSKE